MTLVALGKLRRTDLQSTSSHGDVVEHEGEVTGAAGEHQEMPDLVVSEPTGKRVGALHGCR